MSPCAICGVDPEGKSPQVICDECNGVFHLSCIQMAKVPATYWYCLTCCSKYEQKSTYNVLHDVDFQ